jgi:predicted NACHT family NTPase
LEPDYKRYVPLQASLKWKPTSIEMEDYIVSPMQAEPFSLNTLPTGPEEVSVLVKQAERIVLTGGGGAGKSRTLKHLVAMFAKEILCLQVAPQPIPLYLSLFCHSPKYEVTRKPNYPSGKKG